MVDMQDMSQGPPQEADAQKGAFLRSGTGRIALIAGAVVALLLVMMVVGALVFVFFLSPDAEDVVAKPPGSDRPAVPVSQGATGSAAPETETTPPDVDVVENEDVFKFRDVFVALMKPKPEEEDTSTTTGSTTTTSTGGSTTTTTTSDPLTLVLQDIVIDNGERKAVLTFFGETYQASVGQRLGTTPWQVLKISASSVTMLFGDSQVVLTVGQGIQK